MARVNSYVLYDAYNILKLKFADQEVNVIAEGFKEAGQKNET